MSTNGAGTPHNSAESAADREQASGRQRKPKLSFGLPVFNGQRSIGRVIESIQKQTFRDWELVISDNHSTDATAEVVAERAQSDALQTAHDSEQRGAMMQEQATQRQGEEARKDAKGNESAAASQK